MGQRLTDRLIRELPLPEKGSKVYYDAPSAKGNDFTSGFGIRITAAGAKAFVLNFRVKGDGTERRYTIGRYPEWSLVAARDEAHDLKAEINKGGDPVTSKRLAAGAPTIHDLCARFREEHLPNCRPSTATDYAGIITAIEKKFGSRKVAAITIDDVEKFHRAITQEGHPYRANRTVAVMSKMFSLAIRWRMRSDNPCKGARRNPEQKRERYLSDGELQRLTAALAGWRDQRVADLIRLLMWTGCRRGEAVKARFDQFRLDDGEAVWTKPGATTKTKTDHRVPLSDPARDLLIDIRSKQPPDETRVFPHVVQLAKPWKQICKKAGITGLRLHDLRHSFASTLASGGYSLPVIGKLLGHTQSSTTQRYAHLVDSVLEEATQAASKRLAAPPRKAKIMPLRGRS
jgi:integrase